MSRLTCLLVRGRVLFYQLALAAATRAHTRGLHVAPRARDHRRSGYRVPGTTNVVTFTIILALSLWHECRKTQNRHNVVDIVFSLSSFLCLLPARKITRHILLEVFEHPEPPGAGQEAVAVMLEGGAGGQGVVDPPQPRGHEVGQQHVDTAGTNQR